MSCFSRPVPYKEYDPPSGSDTHESPCILRTAYRTQLHQIEIRTIKAAPVDHERRRTASSEPLMGYVRSTTVRYPENNSSVRSFRRPSTHSTSAIRLDVIRNGERCRPACTVQTLCSRAPAQARSRTCVSRLHGRCGRLGRQRDPFGELLRSDPAREAVKTIKQARHSIACGGALRTLHRPTAG